MKAKKFLSAVTATVMACSIGIAGIACGDEEEWNPPKNTDEYIVPQDYYRTYYEVFVRSFADGNGDKIGDIKGLISKLDYLNDGNDETMTDLGINGIWLMPINSSPSYHKYDVTDYYNIDDEYGTLEDFDKLVEECNKRGIWIQMDLVLNHTSNQHDWFNRAVQEAQSGNYTPETGEYMSRYKFYLKGKGPRTGEARYSEIRDSDYEYLCNFSNDMPDLNLANTKVREEITQIVDFWLERGVHSFRLDAVPWGCGYTADDIGEDNLEFWTWFNDYCNTKGAEVFGEDNDGIDRYCYNVGEVWSGSQNVETYYGTGMSAFTWDLRSGGGKTSAGMSGLPGMVNGRISAYWLAQELERLQTSVLSYDQNAILSTFLSNHDTDRSASMLFEEQTKIKMAAGLYLLSPGNPYIYYGEEIGMIGTGGQLDLDPLRRMPMNWGSGGALQDPPGAINADAQKFGSVNSQTHSQNSILSYYREAIKLRNRFPEIGRGVITACALDAQGNVKPQADIPHDRDNPLYMTNALNEDIAVYVLTWNDRSVMIVHNISSNTRTFNLGDYAGQKVVGELHSNGGKVSLSGAELTLSPGTTAVLKADN